MDKYYYEQLGENDYRPLKVFHAGNIESDEWYARQLCTYHIINGEQYETIANEMSETEEQIIVKRIGVDELHDKSEPPFTAGIFVEFRDSRKETNYKYLNRKVVDTHYEALMYLVKDVVYVEGQGQLLITSREVDEERGGYVIYTKEL